MSEDASLDDFLDSRDDDPKTESDEHATEPSDQATDADETPAQPADSAEPEPVDTDSIADHGATDSSVTPATTTYAWSDQGVSCEECGEPAERRWHQEGRLVCPACKVW